MLGLAFRDIPLLKAFCPYCGDNAFLYVDISNAVQQHVEANGFAVVRKFIGHGVGRDMHEDPEVPNFGKAGRGPRLAVGMTIAIEPMVNIGTSDVIELSDGWTVLSADRSLSSHYEHTVALTENGVEILTLIK